MAPHYAVARWLCAVQNVGYKLRIPQRKPWASIEDDVNGAVALAQSDSILNGVPAGSEDVGRKWIADIRQGLRLLQGVVSLSCPVHSRQVRKPEQGKQLRHLKCLRRSVRGTQTKCHSGAPPNVPTPMDCWRFG